MIYKYYCLVSRKKELSAILAIPDLINLKMNLLFNDVTQMIKVDTFYNKLTNLSAKPKKADPNQKSS